MMLRRVALHMSPAPLAPAPASATTSAISALAGAAVALSATWLMAQADDGPEAAAANDEPASTAAAASEDPNVVQTVEQLRELLPVADAAYGATGLEGKAAALPATSHRAHPHRAL